MTEEEARERVTATFGSVAADGIARFLARVVEENGRQNLIAASTVPTIWARHGWDSLQLVRMAGERDGRWIDIGSGGGFPGILVGLVRQGPTLLVEPRRRRVEFLNEVIDYLGIGDRVTVTQARIEQVKDKADILSARAVAGIEQLVEMAHHCADATTRWVLPRGSIAPGEIEQMRRRWDFMFHVEHSDVASQSQIAVLDGVKRR